MHRVEIPETIDTARSFKTWTLNSGMVAALSRPSVFSQMRCSITPYQAFNQGAIAVLPLSIACAPWGLLVGSMAIDAHLSSWESQGFSAIVFAGAAQLVAIGMLKSGASLMSILLTTLLLTSQHLLYGMHLRPTLSRLSKRWRLGLGFLLTDEFFALNSQHDQKRFDRWYALGVGLMFYVAWNLFTLAGIVLGKSIPNLGSLGLEFSIAATFVALVTPLVRALPTVACVATSLMCSVLFSHWHWESALVLSGVAGMLVGYTAQCVLEEKP